MNKAISAVVIALAAATGWYVYQNQNSLQTPQTQNNGQDQIQTKTKNESPQFPQGDDTPSATEETRQVKEFGVEGTSFKFSLAEIRVKQGDRVKINFTNQQGVHDWRVDEFNAATKVLQAGQSQSIEFIAGKKGTFEYYCSVSMHRQMGMRGNLIVE